MKADTCKYVHLETFMKAFVCSNKEIHDEKKCRLGFEQNYFFKFLSPPVRGLKKIEPAGQPETCYFLRSA